MSYELDLVVLVPGEDDRELLEGLLEERRESLGIRKIRHEIVKHPQRDPGCFLQAPAVLRTFAADTRHALVLFDHEGSGREDTLPEELERDLDERLAANGWQDRARTLVLVPELEVWVWSPSPHVAKALGWKDGKTLRSWLRDEGLWPEGVPKPNRPKQAVERACHESRLPRSSAIYRRIATRAGLKDCRDPCFLRLTGFLQKRFPAHP